MYYFFAHTMLSLLSLSLSKVHIIFIIGAFDWYWVSPRMCLNLIILLNVFSSFCPLILSWQSMCEVCVLMCV